MATLQIALDVPFCTKKEFCRRSGWSDSSLNRAIQAGEIPVLEKKGSKGSVLINLVLLYQRTAAQQA
ncbi:Rha family transcriptional regulator [Vibrio lentus]|uniref:Rha family transcriptional regulator n=1 Tax=Vibrio lentus TaxID=136468 RepID=UPI000C837F6D|nr:Rha family transcriptional regulator [Vibrio lentus]PMH00351.1 Rha family transcriptional regulator [Vibrio lentus]